MMELTEMGSDAIEPTAAVDHPSVSVIIPIYNEEGSIVKLFDQLFLQLDGLPNSFEVIAVNDGSKDLSMERLLEVAGKRKELKVIEFRRNCGQTAAMMAGIDHASNEVIVSLDADLQNDPADIPALLGRLECGFDVVSGWRKDRKDAALRRNLVSRVANLLISKITGVYLHDYGCTLKAYRRDILKNVRLYGEMHRFIPIYASWQGGKVTEIPVRHHPRQFGESKYGLERIVKVILDLMVVKFLDKYFVKPIYIFGGFGIFSIILSVMSLTYMFWLKVVDGISMIMTPLPLVSAMTFLVGVISLLMGLLAEMLVRIYFESQQSRAYSIRTLFNFDETI